LHSPSFIVSCAANPAIQISQSELLSRSLVKRISAFAVKVVKIFGLDEIEPSIREALEQ
jgi:hypothetical protein